MNSGNSIDLMTWIYAHGAMTAEDLAHLRDIEVTSAARALSREVRAGNLEWAWLIKNRKKYWHPYHALGSQSLLMCLPVLSFCACSEPVWTLERRDGPAAIVVRGEEKEALFLDLGGEAWHESAKVRDFCESRNLTSFSRLTVLCPTEPKAVKVSASLRKRGLPIPTRAVWSDALQELLYHAKRQHSRRRQVEEPQEHAGVPG